MIDHKKELLDKIAGLNIGFSEIERETGFPKNTLSNVIKGRRELPNKWVTPFEQYVELKTTGKNPKKKKAKKTA